MVHACNLCAPSVLHLAPIRVQDGSVPELALLYLIGTYRNMPVRLHVPGFVAREHMETKLQFSLFDSLTLPTSEFHLVAQFRLGPYPSVAREHMDST